MVTMYLDRDDNYEKIHKREQGFEERMPALRAAIRESNAAGDPSYQAAFAHWLHDVVRRISSARPQTLKIPFELQLVRGLDAQIVSLTANNEIVGTIDQEECLLYPINKAS